MKAPWLAVLLACGCGDSFATPAELSRPQILAVRATPSAVPFGGASSLDVLVAGPGGVIDDLEVEWELAGGDGEPTGSLSAAGATAEFRAPEPGAADMPGGVARVQIAVRTAGAELVAQKSIRFGVPAADNPSIARLHIAGADIGPGEETTLTPGVVVALAVEVLPRASEVIPVAWYATTGTIERYLGAQSQLEVGDRPGWLFAVARDDSGGVDWRVVRLLVGDVGAAAGVREP